MEMRPYQDEARQAVREREAAGIRSLLTVLPTGTGKTVVFANEVKDRAAAGRVLVLAHREELIQQPADMLRRVAPSLEVGVCKAGRNEIASQVVIASVQTLSQPKRLEAYAGLGHPVLVVTDECHRAVASTYRRIYNALRAGEPGGPLHLGYTATPQRLDGVGLSEVFQEVVFSRDIKGMVGEGWLTEPRGRIIPVDVDLEHVRRNDAGDYSDAGLDEAMDEKVMRAIAEKWWEHAQTRTTVAFTASVASAKMLANFANGIAGGIVAAEVDGQTPPEQRREILEMFKVGRLKLIANYGVLTEGFDAPNVTCILVARPTKSEPLYTQMVGRGLRLWPGKEDCLVLDVTGISAEHSLCVLPMLFGLPAGDMDGKSVSEHAEGLAAEAREHGYRLAQVEEQVDLLRRRRHWSWTEVKQGRVYAVGVGRDKTGADRMVVVRGLTQGPWVAEERRYQGRRLAECRELFRGEGDTATEDAFGVAETFLAQIPEAARLAGTGAESWRARSGSVPATDAQVGAMRKWRISVPPDCTKEQASDLLAQAISMARLRGA